MFHSKGAWRSGLAAAVAASVLLHVGCGDDGATPAGAGGADDSPAGANGLGGADGVAGEGAVGLGGAGLTPGGAPSAGQAGESAIAEGGASAAAGAGSGAGGEPSEPCAGERLGGECFPLFELVQSNVSATGSGASSSSVMLAQSITSGNTVLLAVGIIWTGTATTITVPAAFTLIERRDNAVGAASHESAALYLAESAAAVPALSQATVTVGEAQARLFLGLAEYSGLRASDVLDQKASQAGTSMATPGTTAQTTSDQQLWVVLTMSRGGIDHTAPTEDFAFVKTTKTGAGSFSLMQKLVSQRGPATTSLTSSGDYASVIATLRR